VSGWHCRYERDHLRSARGRSEWWLYVAVALGHAIATQGETLAELREMVRDAVQCHFGDGVPGEPPKLIRLHFVRDEVLAV